jgi:hypothetical protein
LHHGSSSSSPRSQISRHSPQFRESNEIFVSQPFAMALSQLSKPSLQSMRHAESTHSGTPFTSGHASLHSPQCSASLLTSVSQPVDWSRSQLSNGSSHASISHLPVLQAAVA